MRRKPGYTKQGVRDLGSAPKKKVEQPPAEVFACRAFGGKHDVKTINDGLATGDTFCTKCGQHWDWNGQPY